MDKKDPVTNETHKASFHKQVSLQGMMEVNAAMGHESDITRFSCYYCVCWSHCIYAFDVYNTNGDCLALK